MWRNSTSDKTSKERLNADGIILLLVKFSRWECVQEEMHLLPERLCSRRRWERKAKCSCGRLFAQLLLSRILNECNSELLCSHQSDPSTQVNYHLVGGDEDRRCTQVDGGRITNPDVQSMRRSSVVFKLRWLLFRLMKAPLPIGIHCAPPGR